MDVKQKTLANSFIIEGKGLHTGVNVTMNFLPAPEKQTGQFWQVGKIPVCPCFVFLHISPMGYWAVKLKMTIFKILKASGLHK